MALSFSLTSDLPRRVETKGFGYFGYWSRSLTMAVPGRALARQVGDPNGDEAFLCGLLGARGFKARMTEGPRSLLGRSHSIPLFRQRLVRAGFQEEMEHVVALL